MEKPNQDFKAIALLKKGNLGGLDDLIQHYQLRSVRAAYLILRDYPLAEDIVQNAFVQLAQKINTFDDRRPFAPWFMRSVINAAIKAARREKRQVSLDNASPRATGSPLEVLVDQELGPEEQAHQAETRRVVWQALGRLPPEQRAVIVQRYYLEYSEAEMSVGMHRPIGTIKWLLHTARQKLRDLLAAFAPPAT